MKIVFKKVEGKNRDYYHGYSSPDRFDDIGLFLAERNAAFSIPSNICHFKILIKFLIS